jgi:tRNA pseudouridine38-40 synthase
VDLWYEGTGFLRHMVRNLSGTLIEVGSGRRDPEGMTALLAARDRHLAGRTAPAHALTLVWVSYPSP